MSDFYQLNCLDVCDYCTAVTTRSERVFSLSSAVKNQPTKDRMAVWLRGGGTQAVQGEGAELSPQQPCHKQSTTAHTLDPSTGRKTHVNPDSLLAR